MTRVLKAIPTLLTAFGAALPSASKDHRGQLVWKRASGSEDEIYAGVADSSNVAQFRRLLTKTYADTLYHPLIPTSPYIEVPTVSNSAVTGSNASTSDYEVNVQNASFDLPVGTWTVIAWGDGLYAHSSAGGSVRVHLQVGANAGTAIISACQQDPGRSSIGIANAATGQTGSIEIRMEYRPQSGGTAYAGGGWLMAMGFRTA
jgi:hypothetical protein